MGLDPCDPQVGRFLGLAVEALGRPEHILWNNKSVYEPWKNVNEFLLHALDLIEENYIFGNWGFAVLSAMDKNFPLKKQPWHVNLLRKILAPVKRLVFLYDEL